MQTELIHPVNADTDLEIRSLHAHQAEQPKKESQLSLLKYLIIGLLFGIILVKSEVMSWYRIQEMFRLQSFHLFSIIGSAVITGIISVWLIKKFNIKTIKGESIKLTAKKFDKGQIYGGLIFGFGWAITGACPGPLFAQIGSGFSVIIVSLLSAIAGTWVYGLLRENIPH